MPAARAAARSPNTCWRSSSRGARTRRSRQFEALMPYPTERVVELVAPERYVAEAEGAAGRRRTRTRPTPAQLPTFNAYSADGDVTADLVYVNYGMPEDYEQLAKLGIDVKGKIVIARYGRSWRGIKPKVAYEHGAVGCIIYSDPRDDGFFQGDVVPGRAVSPRAGRAARQRDGHADLSRRSAHARHGRPRPARRRLDRSEAPTILKIPVLPISYGDALPLLRKLKGPVAPEAWRGALPITYHVGAGSREGAPQAGVRLAGPAALQRHRPHRRARVSRRVDHPRQPSRRVGQRRVRSDERQRRADGDRARARRAAEDRLAAEAHDHPRVVGRRGMGPARLDRVGREARAGARRRKAVAYINSDSTGEGLARRCAGSHSLQAFVNEVDAGRARIREAAGKSVLEAKRRSRARPGEDRATSKARDPARGATFPIDALGSGSDYTAFLDYLTDRVAQPGLRRRRRTAASTTPSTTRSTGTRTSPTATSRYGAALSQTIGTALLRLADADVLPFEFSGTAGDARAATSTRSTDWPQPDRIRRARARRAARSTWRPSGLRSASSRRRLTRTNGPCRACRTRPVSRWRRHSSPSSTACSTRPSGRSVTRRGCHARHWFKHLAYAPGFYTGYGVKTLPGIREGIEQQQWDEAACVRSDCRRRDHQSCGGGRPRGLAAQESGKLEGCVS